VKKVFNHDLSSIKKFSLKAVLQIDFEKHGAITSEWEFIFDTLLPALSDSVVVSPQGSNFQESPFLLYILNFLRNLFNQLDQNQKVISFLFFFQL